VARLWLDKQAKGSRKHYISSGELPPHVSSALSSEGALQRAEERYELLGEIPGRATIGSEFLIGYVTKRQALKAVSEKQKLFQGHVDNLEELKSKIKS